MFRLYRLQGVDDYVAEQPVQGVSIRDPCTGVPLSAYPPFFPVPLGIRTFEASFGEKGRGTRGFVPLTIENFLTSSHSGICKHFRGCSMNEQDIELAKRFADLTTRYREHCELY